MIYVQQDQALGKRLISLNTIKKDTLFYQIKNYMILNQPTYQSIQISSDQHLWEDAVIYLNHSCDPNIMIDLKMMGLRALKDINAHEELTFFYPSTEWEMQRPFTCVCGAEQCLGIIKGARFLSDDILDKNVVTPHIRYLKDQLSASLFPHT